jgi:hypothetical protein
MGRIAMPEEYPSIEDLDASLDGDMSHVELAAGMINEETFFGFQPRSLEMYPAGTIRRLAAECERLRAVIVRAATAMDEADLTAWFFAGEILEDCPDEKGRTMAQVLFDSHRAISNTRMILAEFNEGDGQDPPLGPSGPEASITCPVCGMTSFHPEDVRRRYCGNCHRFESVIPSSASDGNKA